MGLLTAKLQARNSLFKKAVTEALIAQVIRHTVSSLRFVSPIMNTVILKSISQ